MKQAKFHIVFDRKNETKKNDVEALIYINCAKNGKKLYINTGVKIKKRYWKGSLNQWVNNSHSNSIVLNNIINNALQKLILFDNEQILKGIEYPIESLKTAIIKKDILNFYEFFENEFKENPSLEANSKKNYRSTFNHLTKFGSIKYFTDLNYTNIESFNRFLLGLKLKDTTIEKYHKVLRKVVNEAIKKGYIDENKNPYKTFKVSSKKTEKVCLTNAEILSIENLYIKPHKLALNRAKNMFLFSVYTGVRFSDLQQISKETIKFRNGNTYFEYISVKTKKFNSINLSLYFTTEDNYTKPEKIINEYKELLAVKPFNVSLQPYNRCLKEIAKLANINKVLTSHIARHTFFTFMADKVTFHTLKELGQHSDLKTTEGYIHLNEKMKQDELKTVDWTLK